MEQDAYTEMAEIEGRHWWFVARRKILSRAISSLDLPHHAEILEIGAGTGGNLEMLSQHGQVTAVKSDPTACKLAEQGTGRSVLAGSLPNGLPLLNREFDLICLFDVLEHVEQSVASLRVLATLVAPRGHILISVPAYMWLWTEHDVVLHHKRRYTAARLADEMMAAGLVVRRVTYFNTLLFPLAVAARLAGKWRRAVPAGMKVPSPPINTVLKVALGTEAELLDRMRLPFGLSVMAIGSRA